MKQLVKSENWFYQLLYKRITLILIVLFCVGIGISLASMSDLSTNLIESQALQSAKVNAQIMRDARSLYSSEAVESAKAIEGIDVTHDYPGRLGAIPLPATYLIQLSHAVSEQNPGMSARIYSKYPFPWRETIGKMNDGFDKEALAFLESNPQQTFYRIEDYQGRPTLRYAEADIMKPSCVACHNSHPDSPKRDWQVGQVRGVLEINQPLDNFMSKTDSALKGASVMLGGIFFLALLGITLVIGRLRFINKELDVLVKKRTAELNTANSDLEQARQEVQELRIQVDDDKRKREVDEIVGSDSFDWIAKRGQQWRQSNS